MNVGAYACKCSWGPEKDLRFPASGVRGSGKPPDICARNHAQVLWKNSPYALLTTESSLWALIDLK